MNNNNILTSAVVAALLCAGCAKAPEPAKPAADNAAAATAAGAKAAATAAAGAYLPDPNRKYPERVLWGDEHVHTGWSADAGLFGATLSPEDTVRFVRGEEVKSSSGRPTKLHRAYDWIAVTDHSDGMGTINQLHAKNPEFMADPVTRGWAEAMSSGDPAKAAAAARDAISHQATKTLPKIMMDPKWLVSAWEKTVDVMEKYNEPGKFTAFIAYEWTSNGERGENLHRNVIFRDNKDKADQILPFSSWQSEDPEKLWEWMDKYEKKTGGKMLAIPHNGNLSNGRMFELVDFAGKPLSKDYAERRARWEVLQEMMQTKGSSEAHPLMSPNDEFADFGIQGWDNGNLTLQGTPTTPEMRPHMYLRSGLLQGLAQEQKLGANPFKFGFIGGTDVHNSLTAIEEDNFYGKHVSQEPSARRLTEASTKGLGFTRYDWNYTAAGYAAVWATENTREALWDAMKRKETYATSGSRMTVRFFAGWDFKAEDARGRSLADAGYAKGVPMGADLPKAPAGAMAPTFLLSAIKDPQSGNLDRIQIVKGWLDKSGKGQEKIYDVVWGDAGRRKIDRKGKLTPVGDTVDVATATWTDTIGDPQLSAVWTDPDFDPSVRAFYYARAIEIPTPRWTCYDAVRFGIKASPEVPMKHQERAWTSPIWYSPN